MFSDDESTSRQTKTRMIHAHHLSLIVFYLKHIFSHTPELVQIYERIGAVAGQLVAVQRVSGLIRARRENPSRGQRLKKATYIAQKSIKAFINSKSSQNIAKLVLSL
ncbi:hypothetical protein SFRURICE_006901 [Spodoptera frugiperda]|nr:hypothetical protein SFRURICE_006901 [Spodoptera frugiperda]